MIRRFAIANGGLAELLKPTMVMGTRWKRPKEILWADDYYKDIAVDLDAALFKRVEQRFAHHYPSLADESLKSSRIVGEPASAVIDWIASMLARTQMIALAFVTIMQKDHSEMHSLSNVAPKLVSNAVRIAWFDQMRDMMTRPLWKWCMLTVRSGPNLILTDNPVFLLHPSDAGVFCVLAPLASRRLLIGGDSLPTTFRKNIIQHLNVLSAAWAFERIYSSSREQTTHIRKMLSAENSWAREARKPLFGHLERIMAMRSPTKAEAAEFWKQLTDSLGPSPFF